MSPRAISAVLLALAACGAGGSGSVRDAAADDPDAEVIQLQASRWTYDPATITLQKDVPVILEINSSDVHHGFNVPDLGLRADVLPGRATRVHVTPNKTGTFPFHCDYYCGSGHEDMAGKIIVQ